MRSKVTIKDVARHAGVVPSTVSRAIHGHPDIGPETRARVQEAIQALGYRPDRLARSIRQGRTQSISVMVPMAGGDFYSRLINAIDAALGEQDYDAALFPLLSERRLQRYRDPDALPYQTDGVIYASLDPTHLYPGGRVPSHLPAVLVDIHNPHFDHVVVNNVQGGRLAAGHLLQRPAPTFVIAVEERFNTPFASGVFRERLAGFRAVYREEGVNLPDGHIYTAEFSWESARAATRQLLKQAQQPFNLFATCDLFAQGVIDECAAAHLELGQDVRLIGFDDQPWAAEHGLTTIRQPIEEMGEAAAKLLLERINDPTRPIQSRSFEPTLVPRTTT
ncbi:LacI family DNA-binding transcriptional regulator [Deinococcus metallilatus]|uniref:LacI family transcriptional regulator n=1 Tax=Deinococcus metallilatus TaxID=1211322 RepID=A0ABR6MXE2_9DEIO|nr:LacI family DNA-binding transcriptional regulator [Deinococcus metallilatus]MBB5296610.1 LacI family transcriptional regulator [Deinococcus metallilatus]GMA17528.1 transcriptional regulator [Deinococcus metallilatus]